MNNIKNTIMEGDNQCEKDKEKVNHDSLTCKRKRQEVQVKRIQHIHNWNTQRRNLKIVTQVSQHELYPR